jgi:hypothetical protein
MPRCVRSMHTKSRLKFRSMRMCATNEVGTPFRPRIRTVVRRAFNSTYPPARRSVRKHVAWLDQLGQLEA